MPLYRCVVAAKAGKKTEVFRQAQSEEELVGAFSGAEEFLVSYRAADEEELYTTKRKFSKSVILEFTEIMAALLASGTTVRDCLRLCRSISSSPVTGKLCEGLLAGITRGEAFHKALRMYGSSFSSLYQALVRVGEQTGSVAGVFSRLAAYLRSRRKMRGKIMNALLYPCFVLAVALLGSLAIIVIVMPKMAEIFSAFDTEGSGGIRTQLDNIYGMLWMSVGGIALFTGIAVFAFYFRKKSPTFALWVDGVLLRFPLLGSFVLSVQTLDFAFAMEMLTGGGITVANALVESSSVVQNRALRAAVFKVHERLLKGEKLSASFMAYREFPAYIGTWLTVGEKTGEVQQVFRQIREFFQADVDYTSEKLMTMLEPLLTVVVGMIVLFLVVQFVLPVFYLYGTVL
jgi:type II secretory pathway component PulF